MSTFTDRFATKVSAGGVPLLLVGLLVGGCAPEPASMPNAPAGDNWSVTAWGERFELFPEVAPLIAGETATAHTHVTVLDGFRPLEAGSVEIVLQSEGVPEVFRADTPVRPGIYNVDIEPSRPGEFDLLFRITDADGVEEIRGGSVLVGDGQPGRLVRAPAPRAARDGGEPQSFLKEEQWRSDFGTAWVRTAAIAPSVRGTARIEPPGGGEAVLTSPVSGVVHAVSAGWPYPGLAVSRNRPVVEVVPLVGSEQSLNSLRSDVESLSAELEAAQARAGRLVGLLDAGAVSQKEAESARALATSLAARHRAASEDLRMAEAARSGRSSAGLAVRSPLTGEVAEVMVTPGTTIAAGDPLARVIRTDRVWLDLSVAAADLTLFRSTELRAVLLASERGLTRIDEDVRLVSVAPEISRSNGRASVRIEVLRPPDLLLGSTVSAEALFAGSDEGIVVPSSAVVDDGGVSVVYLQLAGESFVRQEVDVVHRQGDLLRVEGLLAGQRVVTRGGDAIRRASLVASGGAHGHVH